MVAAVELGGAQAGPRLENGFALPDISPNGDQIVYSVLGGDNSTGIYLAPVSGGSSSLVAGRAHENYAPAWSHDGQWIAYQSTETSQRSAIWVMDRFGGNARQITFSNAEDWARGPAWSPDDQWLVYVAGSGVTDFGDIFIVSAKGGEPIQITQTGGRVYDWRVHWGN
jgi:Tol biopolymer transport system component